MKGSSYNIIQVKQWEESWLVCLCMHVGLGLGRKRMNRARSFSLPQEAGIPLGTLTAQLASKSFWTEHMLDESLKQISHCVLTTQQNHPETTTKLHESLAESPMEQVLLQLHSKNPNNERGLVHSQNYSLKASEEQEARELRIPPSLLDRDANADGYQTPPYLSPGITRRYKLRERVFV